MKLLSKQDKSYDDNSQELSRLLGDYDDKYILAIEASLWFPYKASNVTVNINLRDKDNQEIYSLDTFVGTPVPNKNILFARANFGRNKSHNFIPVIFDSFDELCKVSKVEVIWDVRNDESNEREFVVSEYDVSFAESVFNKCYALSTYDMTSYDICNKEKLKNKEIELDLSENSDELVRRLYFEHPLGAEYDDVYLITYHQEQLIIIREAHADESNYVFDVEKTAASNAVTNVILRCLADDFEVNEDYNIPIVLCHTMIELDDERAIAM